MPNNMINMNCVTQLEYVNVINVLIRCLIFTNKKNKITTNQPPNNLWHAFLFPQQFLRETTDATYHYHLHFFFAGIHCHFTYIEHDKNSKSTLKSKMVDIKLNLESWSNSWQNCSDQQPFCINQISIIQLLNWKFL